MAELPADFIFNRFWPVRVREAAGFAGIGGGTQRVRAHMADGDGLTGGSGSGRCGGSRDFTWTDAAGKPAANLLDGVHLSPGKRARPGDESTRAVVIWSLGLEQPQDPLSAIGGPCGDKTSIAFTERLWRSHHSPLRSRPDHCPLV